MSFPNLPFPLAYASLLSSGWGNLLWYHHIFFHISCIRQMLHVLLPSALHLYIFSSPTGSTLSAESLSFKTVVSDIKFLKSFFKVCSETSFLSLCLIIMRKLMSRHKMDRLGKKLEAERPFRRLLQSCTPKMTWTQDPALDWVSDSFSCPVVTLKIIIASLGYIDSIRNSLLFCDLPYHKTLEKVSKTL